jgi:hypothetical protein
MDLERRGMAHRATGRVGMTMKEAETEWKKLSLVSKRYHMQEAQRALQIDRVLAGHPAEDWTRITADG